MISGRSKQVLPSMQLEHVLKYSSLPVDARAITALGAIEYQLNVMNHEQALTLLSKWAGVSETSLPVEADEIARECGHLPLALAMIGAMVRNKPNRWKGVLHKLQNADLDKVRYQFPGYPYPDLFKTIQVSVDTLESNLRARYFDLAVFPEDAPIPESTLQTYWEPEGLDCSNIRLDRLMDSSNPILLGGINIVQKST